MNTNSTISYKVYRLLGVLALITIMIIPALCPKTYKTKVFIKERPFKATSTNITTKPKINLMTLENTVFSTPTVYDLPDYNPIDAASVPGIPNIRQGKYTGTKAYEYASAITNKHSDAYKLKTMSSADEEGFYRYKDRYLVAIGTYFNAPVGTLITITLENGTQIPAVVGDIKSDAHTDENNVYSMSCICATEFIVDKSFKECSGDVSDVMPGWDSKVVSISVYDLNVLN